MTTIEITPIDPNTDGGRAAAQALTEAVQEVRARIAKRRRVDSCVPVVTAETTKAA